MPPAYQMRPEITQLAKALGTDVASQMKSMRRAYETNKEWGEEIERVSDEAALKVLREFSETHGYTVQLVTMPYTAKSTARGEGGEDKKVKRVEIGNGKKNIACLYDTIDGTWNAKAGLDFTVSTMAALTGATEEQLPETLTVGDFSVASVAPHTGRHLFYAAKGEQPKFGNYDDEIEGSVKTTSETNPKKVRCILDAFMAQGTGEHDRTLEAFLPIMKEWSDYGRLYGTGVEMMSLLGLQNAEPPYGGYAAARSKADNFVPPKIILEAAGAMATDWDGNSLDGLRIDDRAEVVVASNSTLHEALLKHLKGRKIPA